MKNLKISIIISLCCTVYTSATFAQYVYMIPLSITLQSDSLFNQEALKKNNIGSVVCVNAMFRPYHSSVMDTLEIWKYNFDSLYRCKHAVQIRFNHSFIPAQVDTTLWCYTYHGEMVTERGQSKDAILVSVKSADKAIVYKKYALRDSIWQLVEYDTSIYFNNRLQKEQWIMYGLEPHIVDTIQVFYEYDTLGREIKKVIQPPAAFKNVAKGYSGYNYDQNVFEYIYEGDIITKRKQTIIRPVNEGGVQILYDENIKRTDSRAGIIYEMTNSLISKEVTRYIKAQGDLNDVVEYYLGETVHRTNRPNSILPEFICISSSSGAEFFTFYYQIW